MKISKEIKWVIAGCIIAAAVGYYLISHGLYSGHVTIISAGLCWIGCFTVEVGLDRSARNLILDAVVSGIAVKIMTANSGAEPFVIGDAASKNIGIAIVISCAIAAYISKKVTDAISNAISQ